MDTGYSSYFASGKDEEETWGVAATGVGHAEVAPGTAYPPSRHPMDHMFSWSTGRILQSFQVVYVSAGRGQFESAATGVCEVKPGTALLLFPGIWHRYRPLAETGWTEDWLELRGKSIQRLLEGGTISPDQPLHAVGVQPSLLHVFQRCHELAKAAPPEFAVMLGLLGMQILAELSMIRATPKQENDEVDASIRRAKALIGDRMDRPLVVEAIAEELGISYSQFRRSFRARTGLTPKQYYLQIRLWKAQDLLANTQLTLREIAEALGFDTAFHLSADFKSRTGLSPTEWRLQSADKANRPVAVEATDESAS